MYLDGLIIPLFPLNCKGELTGQLLLNSPGEFGAGGIVGDELDVFGAGDTEAQFNGSNTGPLSTSGVVPNSLRIATPAASRATRSAPARMTFACTLLPRSFHPIHYHQGGLVGDVDFGDHPALMG